MIRAIVDLIENLFYSIATSQSLRFHSKISQIYWILALIKYRV